MNKIGSVIIVAVVVALAYLLLLVVHPILVEYVATCNTTMSASSNMTNYPGTQGALLSAPWPSSSCRE